MPGPSERADRRAELTAVIQQVRRRWRMKLAVAGIVRWLVAAVLLFLAAAYLLELLRFSPVAIVVGRVAIGAALAGLAVWFIARPQWRHASDEQVALYLEEHEPTLDAALVSALAAGADPHVSSPALTHRVIEEAIEQCQRIERGRRIERQPLKRYAVVAGAASILTLALIVLGPAFVRHAFSALFVLSRSVEAAAPYRIEVTPGDATVPKGADQTITAALHGFDAAEAAVVMRSAPDAAYDRVPLVRREDGAYEGLLFDLAQPIEYFVEAAGVRSRTFRLNVVELPYVKRLDLEYRFPDYTGLEPRTIEDGGDIAVLSGTRVGLEVTPTMHASGGRIVLDDGTSRPLAAAPDGTLTGEIEAANDGFYHIELDAASGEQVNASPTYTIDVLSDGAPTVAISKPGRDRDATPVEELFVEARADDDFAVRELQLVYSVNGGPEKTVALFKGAAPLQEVTAGHTLYLEELGVEPGDALSYYARAADNDVVGGPKRATSDIYFLRIRPFDKEFKPALSQGGGGGGGGGGDVGGLSQQQRQIIAGTFNVRRNRDGLTPEKLREGLVVLTLSQSRLREQVEGLIERMNSRLVAPDPAFEKIGELLPQAVGAMREAEAKLNARNAEAALAPEHKALKFLQQAEEEFELQVSTSRNAGGGGGGAGSIAEDLADLFRSELDKLSNQYETNERASAQTLDRQIDELAEKLRELSRRQEQEIERLQRQAAGQAARGSGDQQRALAEQAEQAARQLERLSREQNRPDLADAARRMQEAADAMRRAAANGDPGAAGQSRAAADRLREAQRQLDRTQAARAAREVRDAMEQAERLAEEQRRIAGEVEQMPGPGPERLRKAQALAQEKNELADRVAELERQLDRASAEMARSERDAARRMQEAAEGIRDDKIKETISYSRGRLLQGAPPDDLREFEQHVSGNLDKLRRRLADASASLGKGGSGDRTADAVDKARELTRGVESLGRRMAERARESQERGERGDRSPADSSGTQPRDANPADSSDARGRSGQAGQQQAGDASADARSADGRSGAAQGRDGGADGAYGWGDAWGDRGGSYGQFTDEDIRQFRGEARRWAGEAQELRNLLREQNIDARDLDEILRRLRALEDARTYKNVREIARLQTFVSEGLKRFEYGLRRRAGMDTDRVLLSGSGDVPAEYKRQVEEYYRSLSRTRPPQ